MIQQHADGPVLRDIAQTLERAVAFGFAAIDEYE
jgi:hypothetical protein